MFAFRRAVLWGKNPVLYNFHNSAWPLLRKEGAKHHKVKILPATLKKRISKAGITLVEIMLSIAMVGVVGASSIWAFTAVNRYAFTNRLLTAAQGVARSQIELVQIDTPFNPQFAQIPPDLEIGTRTETGVTIYSDPNDSDLQVNGSITTMVTDPGWTIGGVSINARQVRVRVTYVYRGKTFNVNMNTFRVSDI